jgi:hypothetical protein
MASRLRIFTALVVLLIGPYCLTSFAQSSDPQTPADVDAFPALTAIAGRGMMNSHAYDYVQELSDEIGGRITGSPQAARAIQWGLAKMKAMGLTNVHEEHWDLPQGWKRISAEAELIAPMHHPLSVTSQGWAGSTPAGGIEADVVTVNIDQLDHEIAEPPSKWTGKALLFVSRGGRPSSQGRSMLIQLLDFLRVAREAHAGVLMMAGFGTPTGRNLPRSGMMGRGFYEVPSIGLIPEDQDLIMRLLERGRTVRVRINVQNQVTAGLVDSANVVGEIPGTVHSEQIIVVCAHLDSLDLGTGATDDGAGVAMTLGAAEAIMLSGQKPKRTIRFILFTGEEQGVLGSEAYIKTHKQEMANHVAALDHDNGHGPTVRLNLAGRDELVPAVQKFADSLKAFGPLAVDNTNGGTDSSPFTIAGVMGINVAQDSPDYMNIIHTAVDTLDKVKPDVIIRDAIITALTAFWIADRPERLADPWPPERTARMLIDQKKDEYMKANGTWPFGDLGRETKPDKERFDKH